MAPNPYHRPVERQRLQQRILSAVTAVLIVAGILSAAVKGADDGEDQLVTSSPASTTTTPAGVAGTAATTPEAPQAGGSSAPASTAPATTTPPAKPGTPSTTGPSPGQPQQQSDFRDLGPVDDAGAPQAPAAGTYSYRFSDDSGENHEASTIVEDKGPTPTGSRRMVLTYRGEGVDLINDAFWGPGDVRFAKTTFVVGSSRFECDWQPDYLMMPLKLGRGTAWESKSSCTVQFGATTAVVNRTTTSKVTDARRVHVAGGEVLTWLIESTDHLDFPGQGSLDTKETTWFAPKLGLPVRQVGETTTTDPEDDGTRSEMVITRLTPS